MATNLAIDNDLLLEAQKLSGLKTKKDTVNIALREFVNHRKQLEILELFGVMEPDADYDYKKARQKNG
ncbi:MAG: type II toxin-antitoxin system VapB family antitoxin [Proteobacteria bacterium]|nr:type II toxin-antitoxin system VapB family antitoxin [Pseudomonadota bacterium]